MRQAILSAVALSFLGSIVIAPLRAQEADSSNSLGFYIGVLGGENLITYKSSMFSNYNPIPDHFFVQNGSDAAQFVGINSEFPLNESHHSSIAVELIADSKSSKFSQVNAGPIVVDSNIITGADVKASLDYVLLNAAYTYNFCSGTMPRGPSLQLGFTMGVLREAILYKGVSYDTSTSQQVPSHLISPTSVSSASAIRIALRPEISYDIPILKRYVFSPFVGCDYPLTQVDSSRSWKAYSVFAGASLRYWVR